MGWIWKEPEGLSSSAGDVIPKPSSPGCSTRKVVKSQCRTEEVEPGKFIRKCQKTEEILKDCVGRYFFIIFLLSAYAARHFAIDEIIKDIFFCAKSNRFLAI